MLTYLEKHSTSPAPSSLRLTLSMPCHTQIPTQTIGAYSHGHREPSNKHPVHPLRRIAVLCCTHAARKGTQWDVALQSSRSMHKTTHSTSLLVKLDVHNRTEKSLSWRVPNQTRTQIDKRNMADETATSQLATVACVSISLAKSDMGCAPHPVHKNTGLWG
jgi:hypothetical protein